MSEEWIHEILKSEMFVILWMKYKHVHIQGDVKGVLHPIYPGASSMRLGLFTIKILWNDILHVKSY